MIQKNVRTTSVKMSCAKSGNVRQMVICANMIQHNVHYMFGNSCDTTTVKMNCANVVQNNVTLSWDKHASLGSRQGPSERNEHFSRDDLKLVVTTRI